MRCLTLIISVLLLGCGSSAPDTPAAAAIGLDGVRTGADVMAESGFEVLDGKRVGLIVNHTAMVDSVHLADLIHDAPNVELVALFGPEHGIRGTADAGAKVEGGLDERTGVPIHSLYGETRRPTPEMLQGVDVLVFDIQDVGSRFYTYISTMGLAMQAAAEAGIEFIVVDRPNPLGGTYLGGFVLEPEFESFVGQYPIPTAHGLTVGELAHLVEDEQMMSGLGDLDLKVIKMEGWSRDDLWPETSLPWIPPSPNIPTFEIALIYAGTCLFEGTAASEGRGTREPFKLIGAPFGRADQYARELNAAGLPGVRFVPERFTPESIEGMASEPKLQGQNLEGVRIEVTDAEAFLPVETGIHVIHTFYTAAPDPDAFFARPAAFDRLAGTDTLRTMLQAGNGPQEIIAAWSEEVAQFDELRTRYLLY